MRKRRELRAQRIPRNGVSCGRRAREDRRGQRALIASQSPEMEDGKFAEVANVETVALGQHAATSGTTLWPKADRALS